TLACRVGQCDQFYPRVVAYGAAERQERVVARAIAGSGFVEGQHVVTAGQRSGGLSGEMLGVIPHSDDPHARPGRPSGGERGTHDTPYLRGGCPVVAARRDCAPFAEEHELLPVTDRALTR